MLENKKNVFWEALLLTVIVFIFGMLVGIAFEERNLGKINKYYANSEISLMDSITFNKILDEDKTTCKSFSEANVKFANRIYEEAIQLEKYEEAGKITEDIKLAHKKYDILRTILWANSIRALEKCNSSTSVIVYLYEYESEDLAKRATQNVWSKILFDLKQEEGNKIILIPIAVDNDLISLNAMIEKLEIKRFPSIIINNKIIISDLTSKQDIQKYLRIN